jgi:PleD family two-component response regulator
VSAEHDARQQGAPEEIAPDGAIPAEQISPTRGRIAVIEDDESTRYFLVQALRAQGYDVKGIEDGASAPPLLRLHRPDIVLLDVTLPGWNGFDVCRQIRRDPLVCEATVILLTGRASAEDRMAGWSAGADDYLIKPCEIPELLARVAAHLRHRESPQEQWLNPVTRLPAPAALDAELVARARRGESFAACFADIQHFKSYNDRYGYLAGNTFLIAVADLLRGIALDLNAQAREAGQSEASLVGHLGSDDFLLITSPEQALTAASLMVQHFSELAPTLYRELDRERGWVPGVDRSGREQQFPLVTLTVATIVRHPAEIIREPEAHPLSGIASELWRQLRDAARDDAQDG